MVGIPGGVYPGISPGGIPGYLSPGGIPGCVHRVVVYPGVSIGWCIPGYLSSVVHTRVSLIGGTYPGGMCTVVYMPGW